jgi:hypothetical protein
MDAYTKRIEDGYITGVFINMSEVGESIEESEYNELYTLLISPPVKDGYYYKLNTNKEWVEFENETSQDSSTPQDDTDCMLVDLDYRVTLLEMGLTESEDA